MNDEGKQVVAVEGGSGVNIRSRMVGRTRDVRRICEMFAADAGRGLHVTGEPGVGKTTLLDAVAETMRETGTRVLRADGVASEADVAYAGLHQILSPVLHRVAELPPEYRSALNVALRRGSGPEPDRLTVVNAVLELLHLASGEEPLLLVIDDLHRLDPASAVVTGFVARRLSGTRIGFLAASRTGVPGGFEGRAPAELTLDPLDDDSAHLLLETRYPGLAAQVRTRVVAEARGNPLALLEFPEQLTVSQRSAQEGLPAVLPLGERTRSLYVSRVTALPSAERWLLLLAALDVTGGRAVLQIAARATDPEAVPTSRASTGLAAAEQDGLIRIDAAARQVVFTHPLIRPTVVDASTFDDRRAAHLALADAAAGHSEVRAWHVAEAAFVPDEAVAAALQKAAYPVLRRGDAVGAVARLVRAGELSPEPGARGRRLAEAASVSAETIGDVAKASDLLRRARDAMDAPDAHPGTSGALYAAVAAAHILINGDADLDIVYRLLIEALEATESDADPQDPALIEALYTLQTVCWWSGREDRWARFQAEVAKLAPAPPILALGAWTVPDPARPGLSALPLLDEVRAVLSSTSDPATLVRGATATSRLDRVGEIRHGLWEVVRSGREGGPARRHIEALTHLCADDLLTGEWEQARQLADEGLALCAAGYPFLAWQFQLTRALLHAARGETEAGEALTETMLRWATRRGASGVEAFAHQAQAVVCLGTGDYESAYRHATALTPAGTPAPCAAPAARGAFDLVEAAVRTGRLAEAAAHVTMLRELRVAELSDRCAMLVAGTAGLQAGDEEAVAHFRRALSVPGADRWAFDAARIRLALGERLRRTTTAKGEAREPLSAALDVFTRLRATPWAERARTELRATGQATGPASRPRTLTPQELEIARMAAAGLTNKQIGGRLHLSHRTVGAHLYRVFPKLGIATRAALRDALVVLDQKV